MLREQLDCASDIHEFVDKRKQTGVAVAFIKKIDRYFALIIACQAVCVALGLWIHSRYITSSAEWAGRKNRWVELERSIPNLQAHPFATQAQSTTSDGSKSTPPINDIDLVDGSGVVLIDKAKQTVIRTGAAATFHVDQKVEWAPLVFADDLTGAGFRSTGPVRGFLRADGRELLAVGLPVGEQVAIIHNSTAEVAPDTSVILQSLPLASGITFAWLVGLHGIAVYLILSRMKDKTKPKSVDNHESSLRRMQALVRTRDTIIFGLAKLAESRDPVTGQHLERIALFSTKLATALRREKEYRSVITPSFVHLIGISSALHDIGKVGIEDSILLKPGHLTDKERQRIQEHTLIGSDCLRQMEKRSGTSNFLQMANEITLYHHERWDGAGYPHGLKGEQIPLAARIVAIADVYDALASERVYKSAVPHDECVNFIRENAGTQFDPRLVEVFLSIEQQFKDISERLQESTPVRFAVETVQPGFPGFSEQPKALDHVLSAVEDPSSVPLELIAQE